MADIKDILGVPRSADAAAKPDVVQPKKEKMKRPEGMSREAFALLGDSHPIMSSQLAGGLKKKDIAKKPKPSTKGIPTYQYRPFKNSARTDGLELCHWIKCYKGTTGLIKEPDEDYPFAKYNKKASACSTRAATDCMSRAPPSCDPRSMHQRTLSSYIACGTCCIAFLFLTLSLSRQSFCCARQGRPISCSMRAFSCHL
jgi:hypothetical protein